MLRLTYCGEYKYRVKQQEQNQCREHACIQQILDYKIEMETVRNIVFERKVHINADFEKANPDYFKIPKYKTPDDVLQIKRKRVCLITAAL